MLPWIALVSVIAHWANYQRGLTRDEQSAKPQPVT